MNKKIVSLAASGAMLLAFAAPAFAMPPFPMFGSKDVAIVTNSTTAIAETGVVAGNGVSVEKAFVGSISVGGNNTVSGSYTGDADASAYGVVVANTHLGCGLCGGDPFHKDVAIVDNYTGAQAGTGIGLGNGVTVKKAGVMGPIAVTGNNAVTGSYTGDATAKSVGVVVVNTHWTH